MSAHSRTSSRVIVSSSEAAQRPRRSKTTRTSEREPEVTLHSFLSLEQSSTPPSPTHLLHRRRTAPGSTNADAASAFPRPLPPVMIPALSSPPVGLRSSPCTSSSSSTPSSGKSRLSQKSYSVSTFEVSPEGRNVTHSRASSQTDVPRRLPPVPALSPLSSTCPQSPRPLPLTPAPRISSSSSSSHKSPPSAPKPSADRSRPASSPPDSPVSITPAEVRQQRVAKMAKLIRYLGDSPPPQLVFGAEFKPGVSCDEKRDRSQSYDVEEPKTSRKPSILKRNASMGASSYKSKSPPPILPTLPTCDQTQWVREVGKNRWVNDDYAKVVQTLREL